LQITTIVNLRFASSLGDGPITYIYLADRLLELPLSLVSVSLGTALLPTLSVLWSSGEKQRMTSTANYFLRLNLYMAVPAAIGLFVLARPLIEVLFQRGEFIEADVTSTALVVRIYAFILMTSSCVRVMVPSFYAIKNTWLPAVASLVSLALHVMLAPYLMKHYGLAGLVSSSFVTGSLNLFVLFIAYRIYIGTFNHARVLKSVGQFLVAGFGLWCVLQVYPFMQTAILNSTGLVFISRLTSLITVVGLAMVTYFGISHFLHIKEYQESIHTILTRVKRKFAKLKL
jgi:putative peptidoglycan lipid II flippase